MPETESPPDASATVVLPPKFDMRAAPDVLAAMRARAPDVALDARELEVVTSAGLQLIVAAARDPDIRLRVPAGAEVLGAVIAELGVTLGDLGLEGPAEVAR